VRACSGWRMGAEFRNCKDVQYTACPRRGGTFNGRISQDLGRIETGGGGSVALNECPGSSGTVTVQADLGHCEEVNVQANLGHCEYIYICERPV